ncbi:histidinol-phosphate aminotransferase [Paenibacillus phyllosphaerae]|uniref:Histidinol-phosphate aminotransferase n=1 Tax=Paenibacillus phyllosphaerae TaxID=274593 RepID=A0A7W5AVL9_9BACL|nr:histidinol-phosphate transaminase [Paenibacillus phyllosphaerae]MBB3109624.1 histidinol-phosphate aminotransferase [Paenibacillus phyllosphaerae]
MGDNVQARGALQQLKAYSPGKPIWEVQREFGLTTVVKLASNENPLGPSPRALEAIASAMSDLHRYPDAQTIDLRKSIAGKFDLPAEQIIVTNGGDELITLVSEAFLEEGDEVIVPGPSFSEYEFAGKLMCARIITIPLSANYEYDVEAMLDAVSERTKIMFLCSPNNPTGTILRKAQLQRLLDALPKRILVVLDTAYSHYVTADDYTDGIEYVKAGYPLLCLRTFSKAYGLAGIRVGYGIAPESIIRSIVQVKEPFNVNALAQVAAAAAILDDQHVEASSRLVQEERQRLYGLLRQLGIPYTESMSNFILIKPGASAERLCRQLMESGVIVRFGGGWGLPDHIRITVGLPEENDMLMDKLRELHSLS